MNLWILSNSAGFYAACDGYVTCREMDMPVKIVHA